VRYRREVGDGEVMAAAICSQGQEARGGGEAKVGAALDAVESGRGGGTFYRAEEATEGREDGAVRGTAGGASSTCRLREWRRGDSHLMRGK
jgi:hypothetical protein